MIAVLPILLYPLLGMSLFQISPVHAGAADAGAGGRGQESGRPAAAVRQASSSPRSCSPIRAGRSCWNCISPPTSRRRRARRCPTPRAEADAAGAVGQVRGGALLSARLRRPARRLPRGHPPPGEKAARPDASDCPSRARPAGSAQPRDHLQHGQRQIADRLRPAARTCCGAGRSRSATTTWPASGVPSVGRAAVLGRAAPTWPTPSHRGAVVWSKILPVLLLLWALTGAFYPAVDLCAGEKERGTLETLLSSPAAAQRDRGGQAADDHALQHRHGRAEPGEHGNHRLDGGRRSCRASGCRRRWRLPPWRSPWCRFRPCSAPCAWRWRPSRGARRKGNTT